MVAIIVLWLQVLVAVQTLYYNQDVQATDHKVRDRDREEDSAQAPDFALYVHVDVRVARFCRESLLYMTGEEEQ